jgi:plasmid stabilization system protein ParE
MKRRLEVTPQARRDVAGIQAWYHENLGARAARKVAETLQSRLRALERGRVKGAELAGGSRHRRALAKKHIVIFRTKEDVIWVVRIVHGSQDLEAVAAQLDRDA